MLTFETLPEKVKEYFKRNITTSVAFVKAKDGAVRHMAYRRNLSSYVKSDKEKTEKQANMLVNNNLMNVYDTNKYISALRETGDSSKAAGKSFRNFRLENVLAFMCGGEVFDMREENNILERFGKDVYEQLTPGMIRAMKGEEDVASKIDDVIKECGKLYEAKKLAKNKLIEFIKEEVKKLHKMTLLEQEKSQIKKQLRLLKENDEE